MTAGAAAGYSGRPLLKKLGVREGSTLTLVGAPAGVIDAPPASVTVRRQARGSSDVVVAFFTRRQDLERRVEVLSRVIYPAGRLWVAWPKRSSGVQSTVNEDVVRAVALPLGLVDNKVCAIDQVWSGLRLVIRRELR